MRVCHIGFSHYPGIGAVSMYEHSQNLAKLGADVHVIAAGDTTENKKVHDVNVSFIKTPSVKNLSVYPLLFSEKALSYIRNFPPSAFDIAHIYHFPSSFLLPVLERIKASNWVFFTSSGPVRGGIVSKAGWEMQRFESHFFDHIILRDKSHIPVFSYREKDDITIVPIGADLDIFSIGNSSIRQKYGVKDEEFLFLYAGTLHPLRNIEVLVDSLKNVAKKYPVKLMLVGDHGTERLQKHAAAIGIQDKVICVGSVPYTEVPSYMQCCDTFISYVPITPEFTIQPPLKTVEALACGLPVIATDTLGNRRFITCRENGLLSKDDAASIQAAMIEIIKNESLREKLKKNARPSVSQYSWNKIVKENLLPLYERLVEK